jgi:hypothetical protein
MTPTGNESFVRCVVGQDADFTCKRSIADKRHQILHKQSIEFLKLVHPIIFAVTANDIKQKIIYGP